MSFIQFTAYDIQKDDQGDTRIVNGDIVVAPSDAAHQRAIILSPLGNYRFAPTVGVDIYQFLNTVGTLDEAKQLIQQQLEQDGYQVISIDFTPDHQLNVTAKRVQ